MHAAGKRSLVTDRQAGTQCRSVELHAGQLSRLGERQRVRSTSNVHVQRVCRPFLREILRKLFQVAYARGPQAMFGPGPLQPIGKQVIFITKSAAQFLCLADVACCPMHVLRPFLARRPPPLP